MVGGGIAKVGNGAIVLYPGPGYEAIICFTLQAIKTGSRCRNEAARVCFKKKYVTLMVRLQLV